MKYLIVALVISLLANIILWVTSKKRINTIIERNEELKRVKDENQKLTNENKGYKIYYNN